MVLEWFCLLVALMSPVGPGAQSAVPATQRSPAPDLFGPYCGVRSLYAAMRYYGADVNFPSLLKPEYIGSPLGSSVAELQRAAKDRGFHTLAVSGITETLLKGSPHPIILSTRKNSRSVSPDHYVLFIRPVEGGARVLDAPNPVRTVSYAELLSQCTGVGLVVSPDPIEASAIFGGARRRVVVIALGVLAGAVVVAHLARSRPQRVTDEPLRVALARFAARSSKQAALLALIALAGGGLLHVALDEQGPGSARGRTGNPATRIEFERMVRLVGDSDVVIVDARHPADFEEGHIRGAINVPPDMPDADRRALMGGVRRDARIAVYCQSNGCPYADAVSAALREDGFSQLMIYGNGWVEWEARMKTMPSLAGAREPKGRVN